MRILIKKFEELTCCELYDVLKLRSEVFVVEQNCAYCDPDGWDKVAAHIIIEEDDKVVATARILPAGTRFPQVSIGRVVVDPAYRHRRLGKLLMEKAIAYATGIWSAKEMKISAQLYLRRFYEDLGFSQVTEVYDEDGIPHIGMVRLC